MKIKVLAAMMTLASTGAMATLVTTPPADLVGATNSSSTNFVAATTVTEMCKIGTATGEANLGFGEAPRDSASFTVLSNASASYLIEVTNNGTTKLDGELATVNYVAGITDTELPLEGKLEFANGVATLDIGVMLTEQAHQLKAGKQTVTTTVTISCAPSDGEGA